MAGEEGDQGVKDLGGQGRAKQRGGSRGGGRNRLCSVGLCFEKIFPRRCGEPVKGARGEGPRRPARDDYRSQCKS